MRDDELLCGVTTFCPRDCVCYGLSYYCHQPWNVIKAQLSSKVSKRLRFLHISHTNTSFDDMSHQIDMMIYLNLSHCATYTLKQNYYQNYNIRQLDLSSNFLTTIKLCFGILNLVQHSQTIITSNSIIHSVSTSQT